MTTALRRVAAVGLAAGVALSGACRNRERAAPAVARAPAPTPASSFEFRSFEITSGVAKARGIVAGPDGAMWFTESSANRIARISTDPPHAIEEFPLPHEGSEPWAITRGPDGNVYFTEAAGNRIGWIEASPPHAITEIPVPSSKALPRAIADGPDRNVWFPDFAHIARRVTATGAVEEYAAPRRQGVTAIAAGPDGNLWWGSWAGSIVRLLPIFPDGMLELPLRLRNSAPTALVAASDGNIWFLQMQADTLGRLLVSEPHTITELQLPKAARADAGVGLCATPGAIWVTRAGERSILRIDVRPPHRVRVIPVPREIGDPEYLASGPDGNVWFTSAGNRIGVLLTAERRAPHSGDIERDGQPAAIAFEYRPAEPIPVTGEVDVRTDRDCTLFVDGLETVRLTPADGQVLKVSTGAHKIVGVAAGGDARAEKSVEVFDGLRAYALLDNYGRPNAPPPTPAAGASNPNVEFVSIPAGEFVMGSDAGPADGRPAHRVRIARPFEMAKYELTQKEWQAVMGPLQMDTSETQWSVPRPRIRYMDVGESKPVIGVSWNDAAEFLAALNRIAPGRGYRLPTEAEWEYACRAGTGEDLPAEPDLYAWTKSNFELEMHPVGKKRPNAWDLYDMHGNASEWVYDWYDPDFYRRSPAADPVGPPSGSTRIYRGGDAWNPASNSACSRRTVGQTPAGREGPIGIRLVREAR